MYERAVGMIGFRSGMLTVTAEAKGRVKGRDYWLCRCDSGGSRVVMGKYLRRNEVKSCGCLNRQPLKGPQFTHGHAPESGVSRTYRTWASMLQRCTNPKSTIYYKYGAKGISVCKRWHKFKNFLEDMGPRPPGRSIDRVQNKKGYTPGNCRWATPKEQVNNSSAVRIITFNGESHNLTEWAGKLGVTPGAMHTRLRKWTMERALTQNKS